MSNRYKVFFDTEFTQLQKNTDLISIGMITEDNKKFYGISKNFDKSKLNPWLEENVIPHLYDCIPEDILTSSKTVRRLYEHPNKKIEDYCGLLEYDNFWLAIGDTEDVLHFSLLEFLNESRKNKEVEFWSDCLAYDWILLCDILSAQKTALDIPEWIYYIPFDICTMFKLKGIDPDISRKEFSGVDSVYHNSLGDAEMIKGCYEKLYSY